VAKSPTQTAPAIALFAGSGAAIAALNLYGRDPVAMAPLIVGVWSVYDPDRPSPADHHDLRPLDPGGQELLAGFAEAITVRGPVQLILGVIMGREYVTARDAYVGLRLHAGGHRRVCARRRDLRHHHGRIRGYRTRVST
jgi:hypothetical protein